MIQYCFSSSAWLFWDSSTLLLCVCVCVHTQSLQLCPTLCNPMDCSPSGSSDHGTLQARTLEWVAVPSSRGSSRPRDSTRVSYFLAGSLPLAPSRKPCCAYQCLILSGFADFATNCVFNYWCIFVLFLVWGYYKESWYEFPWKEGCNMRGICHY